MWGSAYGVKLALDNFTKSMFYYLFMYGVGLRVGPSFVNSLGGDGLKFTLLAVVSCVVGLILVVLGANVLGLPPGAAGGMLAGSQTMSAAIGSAEEAINAGVVTLPAGMTKEQATSMIALSYGITYIWGTVGIILITKYLPNWWGIDAKAAARAVRSGARRGQRRHAGPDRLDARGVARLPAGEHGLERQVRRRAALGQSRISHRQRRAAGSAAVALR